METDLQHLLDLHREMILAQVTESQCGGRHDRQHARDTEEVFENAHAGFLVLYEGKLQ